MKRPSATLSVPPRVRWGLYIDVRMRVMGAPRKYPDEPRERAVRDGGRRSAWSGDRPGALARICKQLRINDETLRLGYAGRDRRRWAGTTDR